MKKLLIILIFTIIIGCATAKQTYTSNGQEGYMINCSGSARNWGMCYEKAGEICGDSGYIVIEKSSDQGAVITADQYRLFGGSVTTRTIIIKCK